MILPGPWPRLAAVMGLAVAAFAAPGEPAPRPSIRYAVANGAGRLQVSATDCPLDAFLTALCAQLTCDLYLDPVLSTNRLTLSCEEQAVEPALYRLLKPFDYMLVWKTELDPAGRRRDRISGIRVYRAGHFAEAIKMGTGAGGEAAGAPLATARLGDRQIAELAGKLAGGHDPEEARLAAEALARDGSPAAVKALLAALPRWDEGGLLADPVSAAALSLTNGAAGAALLEAFLAAQDESVELASRFALSRLADSGLVRGVGEAYARLPVGDPARQRIEDLLAVMASREAEPELIRLAGAPDRVPASALEWSALKGLANMGTATATDRLLEGVERSRGGSAAELAGLIGQAAASPPSVAALRYAALGNKRFSGEETRLAALRALARFMDPQTLEVLRTLAAGPAGPLRDEAARQLATVEAK